MVDSKEPTTDDDEKVTENGQNLGFGSPIPVSRHSEPEDGFRDEIKDSDETSSVHIVLIPGNAPPVLETQRSQNHQHHSARRFLCYNFIETNLERMRKQPDKRRCKRSVRP